MLVKSLMNAGIPSDMYMLCNSLIVAISKHFYFPTFSPPLFYFSTFTATVVLVCRCYTLKLKASNLSYEKNILFDKKKKEYTLFIRIQVTNLHFT